MTTAFTVDQQDLVALLREIIALWNSANPQNSSQSIALDDLISTDFDPVDRLNHVRGLQEVEEIVEGPQQVWIRFHDSVGDIHRAEFVRMPSKEWKLRSIKFQCPVCFGTGVNDGEPCLGCGGTGWGAGS